MQPSKKPRRATGRIKDRFWLWGHEAGCQNGKWHLPGQSRVEPVAAAAYMGIPNVIMVRYQPAALTLDAQYLAPFQALRQVVWSIVGAGGRTSAQEREQVVRLARDLPNLAGVMMDDFFRADGDADHIGTLSPAELRQVRALLAAGPRPLDLWVVLYDYQLHLPVQRLLEFCDRVTFWTWKAGDLHRLDENFARVEALTPAPKYLGCYLWDYGNQQPLPLELVARQCRTGLQWLREGRIAGLIFLASCICDLGLEAVEWTRQWIAEVGEEAVDAREVIREETP